MHLSVPHRRSGAEAADICRLIEQRGVRVWLVAADADQPQASARPVERVLFVDGGRHLAESGQHGSNRHS